MPTQLERPDNTLVEDYIYSNYNYIIFPMPSTKKKSIEWILTLFKQEKYNELGCHLIVQIGLWKWKMKWMKNIHGQASIHPSIFSCLFFIISSPPALLYFKSFWHLLVTCVPAHLKSFCTGISQSIIREVTETCRYAVCPHECSWVADCRGFHLKNKNKKNTWYLVGVLGQTRLMVKKKKKKKAGSKTS